MTYFDMNFESWSFFQLQQRRVKPRKGRPATQMISIGTPTMNRNLKCSFPKHFRLMSWYTRLTPSSKLEHLNSEKLKEVNVGCRKNMVAIMLTDIFLKNVLLQGLNTVSIDQPMIKVIMIINGISPVSAILKN